jgi:hypothetical protein
MKDILLDNERNDSQYNGSYPWRHHMHSRSFYLLIRIVRIDNHTPYKTRSRCSIDDIYTLEVTAEKLNYTKMNIGYACPPVSMSA